jgi:hypothetical protein
LRGAGGNYVRNTMASREILPGHRDLWPYEVDWDASTLPHQTRDPLRVVYDLTRWNEAYWERFERMLQTTADFGMVLEIEIWGRHDKYRTRDQAGWERHPYNPDNNVNYTAEESRLPTGEWTHDPGHHHDRGGFRPRLPSWRTSSARWSGRCWKWSLANTSLASLPDGAVNQLR